MINFYRVIFILLVQFIIFSEYTAKTIIDRKYNTYFCDLRCGRKHYACEYAPCYPRRKCGRAFQMSSMDNKARDSVLNWHNEIRNKIANGFLNSTKNEKIPGANLIAMQYDKELEFIAQCWASTCQSDTIYDKCTATKRYNETGQSIFIYSTIPSHYDPNELMRTAFDKWTEVLDMIKEPLIEDYIRSEEYASATQAIWAETKEVGCGRARFGKGAQRKFIIVCNYGPKGNVEKSQIFKKGKGCSSCPNGLSCNKEYPSLCGRVNNHRFDHWKPPFVIGASTIHTEKICSYILLLATLYF